LGFECDCCKIRLELGWGEIPGKEQETNGQGTCAQQPALVMQEAPLLPYPVQDAITRKRKENMYTENSRALG